MIILHARGVYPYLKCNAMGTLSEMCSLLAVQTTSYPWAGLIPHNYANLR